MTPFLGLKPLMLPDIYNSRGGDQSPPHLSFHTLMLTDPVQCGGLPNRHVLLLSAAGNRRRCDSGRPTVPGMLKVEPCEAAPQLHWELFLLEAITLGC